MGEWPNHPLWSALRRGDVEVGTELYHLEVVDCGDLCMPSGKLVACDPFAGMNRGGNPYVQLPPGRYPVRVTVADVSGKGDGSHPREAYASLLLRSEPEVERRVLSPVAEGEGGPVLGPGEFLGFPVDSGTACFVDDEALRSGMPPEHDWYDNLFDNEDPGSWFQRMDDPEHIREGIANIPLPFSDDDANLILFHSGWGDGFYPVIGGYNAAGELVAVHIDFWVVSAERKGEGVDEDADF